MTVKCSLCQNHVPCTKAKIYSRHPKRAYYRCFTCRTKISKQNNLRRSQNRPAYNTKCRAKRAMEIEILKSAIDKEMKCYAACKAYGQFAAAQAHLNTADGYCKKLARLTGWHRNCLT